MFREFYALFAREILKTYRNVAVVIMMVAQPIIWLAFFGSSFGSAPKTFLSEFFHTSNYIAFLLPGIMTVSMLFVGMFGAMSLIQDKRLGFLRRILVSSPSKSAVFLGKVFGAMTRGLFGIPIMLAVAVAFGVVLPANPFAYIDLIAALFFFSLGMVSIYFIITIRSSDWQTPGVIANFINLPLMFSSTAIFPEALFPSWMRTIATYNPVTYAADVGRSALLSTGVNLWYILYLAIFGIAFMALGMFLSKKWLSAD